MNLHLTTESERGKPVTKSGNDFISIIIKGHNRKNILELKIEDTGDKYTIKGYVINKEHAINRKSEQYLSYSIEK